LVETLSNKKFFYIGLDYKTFHILQLCFDCSTMLTGVKSQSTVTQLTRVLSGFLRVRNSTLCCGGD